MRPPTIHEFMAVWLAWSMLTMVKNLVKHGGFNPRFDSTRVPLVEQRANLVIRILLNGLVVALLWGAR